MKELNNKMLSRSIHLREFNIKEIVEEDQSDEDIQYISNAKYKITKNIDGIVIIMVKCESFFKPELIFTSSMTFNMFIEFEKDILDEEIRNNIHDFIQPIAADISLLLATATKSMNSSPVIVPPNFNEIISIE